MADLLLELGCEELPSAYLRAALAALEERAPAVLTATGLLGDAGAVEVLGTPRRLAVVARGLAPALPAASVWEAGPPEAVAFDSEGRPTKAAEGFARGKGVAVDALTRRDGRVGLLREAPARPAAEVLAGPLADLLAGVPWPKSMRWGSGQERCARPVHWICALVGGQVIDLCFGRVAAGQRTRGHRHTHPDPVVVSDPDAWHEALRARNVLPSAAERAERIVEGARALAEQAGGRLVADPENVADNAHLTEWPLPCLGRFDPEFLDVPREVVVGAMRAHQRYFAVEGADGRLLPCFVAVNNTPVRDEAVVRSGHERVLRARLADARFFWDEDRRRPLAGRRPDLEGVIFLAKLARPTMRDKADRIAALGRLLAGPLGADPEVVDRAASLCKADLTTLMVQEFPDLQGVMGRYYASHDGERLAVCDAIRDHYLPRGADDALPPTAEGATLALADRLDSLAAGFACGLRPTGSKDAYGLRRAALGVIRILRDRGVALPIGQLMASAAEPIDGAPAADLAAFVLDRGRHLLVAEGVRGDVADAVLATGLDEVIEVGARAHALSPLVGRTELQPVFAGLKRVRNIVAKEGAADLPAPDPGLFEGDAERDFLSAVERAARTVDRATSPAQAVAALVEMRGPIDRFFDDVLVVAPDPCLRRNRLALCQACEDVFGKLADFSRIQV